MLRKMAASRIQKVLAPYPYSGKKCRHIFTCSLWNILIVNRWISIILSCSFLQHCYPGHHRRVERDASFHDTASLSVGPLSITGRTRRHGLLSFHNFCILVDDKELEFDYIHVLKFWFFSCRHIDGNKLCPRPVDSAGDPVAQFAYRQNSGLGRSVIGILKLINIFGL